MTPTKFRSGGTGESIRFAVSNARWALFLSQPPSRASARSCSATIQALVRELQDSFPKAQVIGGDEDFEHLVAKVVAFVEAPALGLDLPLDVRGTAFQQRVWQALREIPPGSTASYTEIAATHWRIERGVRCGGGLCSEHARGRHSLPSRRAQRRFTLRLPVGREAQTGTAESRGRND